MQHPGASQGRFRDQGATVAASRSVAGAMRSSSCSVRERRRGVSDAREQQSQRPGALQEAWTCPLNGQIESGIDRCVDSVVVWARSFILIRSQDHVT